MTATAAVTAVASLSDLDRRIEAHYRQKNALARILAAVAPEGRDPQCLRREDLHADTTMGLDDVALEYHGPLDLPPGGHDAHAGLHRVELGIPEDLDSKLG